MARGGGRGFRPHYDGEPQSWTRHRSELKSTRAQYETAALALRHEIYQAINDGLSLREVAEIVGTNHERVRRIAQGRVKLDAL